MTRSVILFLALISAVNYAQAFTISHSQRITSSYHNAQQSLLSRKQTLTSRNRILTPVAVSVSVAAAASTGGENQHEHEHENTNTILQSRRAFAKVGILSTVASLTLSLEGANAEEGQEQASTSISTPASSADQDPLIDVYFGCGCFWHVQHEFVMAEKKILGRSDEQITARAGYAGGLGGSLNGKVCYHNAANVADYGKLGHAEVVGLTIPKSKFGDFAVEYFKLFDANGNRPDQAGDRGTEYRSLVGVPGGAKGEYAKILVDSSIATGDKLDFAFGKGDDKDVRKTSFVMDNAKFPFYVAEQYHQFHDGFNLNENYPASYNKLAAAYAKGGEDFGTCPNGMVGLGFGGL